MKEKAKKATIKNRKRPYRPPKLTRFGDLREITQGPAKGGIAQDGGAGGPKSKLTGNII
jgi:hypothetical protein